jgi:NAD(P)H dehydrogenase (quinone)
MHAPPKSHHPAISVQKLPEYDAMLFGVPTRFGNFPGQWKAFIDMTGGLWQSGALSGKYYGLFISSGTQGGGQESTALAAMSTFAHHGMIYVPLGYKHAFPLLADLTEIRGGSPWGAGTFAVRPPPPTPPNPFDHNLQYILTNFFVFRSIQAADGSRQPSQKELELAEVQGKMFYETVSRVNFA